VDTDIDSLRALADSKSPTRLAEAVDRLTERIGIGHWIYAVDLPVVNDSRQQFVLGGYPSQWVEHYFRNDYLRIDPVIAHCQDRSVPFLWRDAMRRPKVVDPRLQSVWRLFGEAGEFGLRSGLSVPLHGPGSSWGLMSFARGDRDTASLDAMAPLLTLAAHFTHDAARAFGAARLTAPAPTLTRRERQCLHWAAQGKTSWEIGCLLAISERTAVFHLQNACHKLGVVGRQAAVARAVAQGLISME
jgi:DNA-binding CsgD family transcriptional regulator